MTTPTGTTEESQVTRPAKALLQRIDIGLTTGIIAVLIAFLSLLVAQSQTKMALQAQKASVLPIIDIDMGYVKKTEANGKPMNFFDVTLNNVGAGIAHVQTVTPLQNGQPITDYKVFENAIMTPRMRGWAQLTEAPAAGYLRAGDSITPASYRMGAAGGDLSAYLRGEWGSPIDGIDISVCYCSVFDDCWTVDYLSRKTPKAVSTCGIKDSVKDGFQSFTDQRVAKRQKNN